MRKILVFLFLLASFSFSSDFEKMYKDYSKGYSNTSRVSFLSHYINKSDILHQYFFNSFGFYYGPRGSDFFIKFIAFKERFNKDINFALYEIKRDIEKMLCNDPILNTSVFSGIEIEFFIILDDPKNPQHLFTYDNKTSLNCSY